MLAVDMADLAVSVMLTIHTGPDKVSAFGTAAARMNCPGPGLGTVAFNFQAVGD